jgi:hypothetical protein
LTVNATVWVGIDALSAAVPARADGDSSRRVATPAAGRERGREKIDGCILSTAVPMIKFGARQDVFIRLSTNLHALAALVPVLRKFRRHTNRTARRALYRGHGPPTEVRLHPR